LSAEAAGGSVDSRRGDLGPGRLAPLASRSDLDREELRLRLVELVGPGQVCLDEDELRRASIDRFKKYQAVNGIFSGPIPAAIVSATSSAQVAAVLRFCDEHRVNVVARTGGTATEGGLETVVEDSVVLDGSAMNAILAIDEVNMMVTAQCGVPLQELEDAVRAHGLTTTHSPQSKPIAQLGGLIATRSIGQLSTLYGGIEDLVVGLEAVFPDGTICTVKNVPRRAAGPDIRHVVIGNEGALCFITAATLKLFRYEPGNAEHRGYLVADMATGIAVLREIVTAGYRPAVCRLYSEEDARQHLGELTKGRCMLVFVCDGPRPVVLATASEIERAVGEHPNEAIEPSVIASWFASLNWGQDKIEAERATMRDERWLGYTTEVSANWSDIVAIYDAVMHRIRHEYPYAGDVTMLGAHSSHSYQTGTNLYFVYDYRIDCPPEEEIEKYHIPLNAIVVEEALRHGGSMVHHHGIGKYRTHWTEQEHGSAYYMLRRLKDAFDPNGVMNAGTIYPAQR
jgi:alkyldihydroxyacetonephosphate synthase